eukprot:COSAG04_NODE_1936_length_5177_cov_5.298740_7_plen_306_part_00
MLHAHRPQLCLAMVELWDANLCTMCGAPCGVTTSNGPLEPATDLELAEQHEREPIGALYALAQANSWEVALQPPPFQPSSKRGPWTMTLRLTGWDAPSIVVTSGEGPKLKQAKAVVVDVLMGAWAPKVGQPHMVYTQLMATEQDDAHPYYGATQLGKWSRGVEQPKLPLAWKTGALCKGLGGVGATNAPMPHGVAAQPQQQQPQQQQPQQQQPVDGEWERTYGAWQQLEVELDGQPQPEPLPQPEPQPQPQPQAQSPPAATIGSPKGWLWPTKKPCNCLLITTTTSGTPSQWPVDGDSALVMSHR